MKSTRILKTRSDNFGTSYLFLSLFLLLLAFFVFLNSISSYEIMKSYNVTKSVRANFPNLTQMGSNKDLITQNQDNKIDIKVVKRLEDAFSFFLPTVQSFVFENQRSFQIEVPLTSLFGADDVVPNKKLYRLIHNIGEILLDYETTQPLSTEILFGYNISNSIIELDEITSGRINSVIDTMIRSGSPRGSISIGLEPRDPSKLYFRITNNLDGKTRGR